MPQTIAFLRRAFAAIRQGVIFSTSMNALAVVLGGFGIVGSVVGALMDEASAIPVLANSARLISTPKIPFEWHIPMSDVVLLRRGW